jgi:hypothetical protein
VVGEHFEARTVGIHWQSAATSWSQGDFNGDGRVDALDLNQLGKNWLQTAAASSEAAVPEPSGWFLVLARLFVWLRRKAY